MSSFIGHGLAALTTYGATPPKKQPFSTWPGRLLWFVWLIIIAWAPDIDHVVPTLTLANNEGMRITHAFASSLLLPGITLMLLWARGVRSQRLKVCWVQVAVVGVSHPLMDWLVGVIGLPLFWPFHKAIFVAPIGLLPSAGSLHWQNYYFWENLFIELGIIVPLMMILLRNLPWQKKRLPSVTTVWQTAVLAAIALYFLHWSMGLSR